MSCGCGGTCGGCGNESEKSVLVFDDIIMQPVGGEVYFHTLPKWNNVIGNCNKLILQVEVQMIRQMGTGTPDITIALQGSANERNWYEDESMFFFLGTAVNTTGSTTLVAQSETNPAIPFHFFPSRLMIGLDIANDFNAGSICRVKIYTTPFRKEMVDTNAIIREVMEEENRDLVSVNVLGQGTVGISSRGVRTSTPKPLAAPGMMSPQSSRTGIGNPEERHALPPDSLKWKDCSHFCDDCPKDTTTHAWCTCNCECHLAAKLCQCDNAGEDAGSKCYQDAYKWYTTCAPGCCGFAGADDCDKSYCINIQNCASSPNPKACIEAANLVWRTCQYCKLKPEACGGDPSGKPWQSPDSGSNDAGPNPITGQ